MWLHQLQNLTWVTPSKYVARPTYFEVSVWGMEYVCVVFFNHFMVFFLCFAVFVVFFTGLLCSCPNCCGVLQLSLCYYPPLLLNSSRDSCPTPVPKYKCFIIKRHPNTLERCRPGVPARRWGRFDRCRTRSWHLAYMRRLCPASPARAAAQPQSPCRG